MLLLHIFIRVIVIILLQNGFAVPGNSFAIFSMMLFATRSWTEFVPLTFSAVAVATFLSMLLSSDVRLLSSN